MKIVEFKDYDNQTTPLSAYNLNRLQQNLITTKYQMTFSSAVSGGSIITLPCYYQVGQDTLDVYLNSELLKKASTKDSEGHYYEVGNSDKKSNQIKITSDWSIASGDVLNLIVRGTTDSYDQNLSPDKATQLADEISANKEEITALQTENSRLKGITNALPKISGEDTSLTLTNTANAPLSDIILKGNTSQQKYSGKNLFDKSKALLGYWIENEQGDAGKGPDDVFLTDFIPVFKNVPVYIPATGSARREFYNKNKVGTTYLNNKNAQVFTPTEDGFIRVTCKISTVTMDSLMIYYGTTETDYEPYVGGTASPNPDYPQDIKVVSGNNTIKISNKNLLNGTHQTTITANGITITSNSDDTFDITGISTSETRFGLITNIDQSNLVVGKTYYFYMSEKYNSTNLNVSLITHTPSLSYWIANNAHTIEENQKYNNIVLYVPKGVTMNYHNIKFMINEGSTAIDYVPNKQQVFPISLGSLELCKIGNYQDYLYKENDKWYKHKVIDKVQLLSSFGWRQYVGINYYTMSKRKYKYQNYLPCNCFNHIICSLFGTDDKPTNNINIYDYQKDNSSTITLDELKTILDTKDVYVYLELITPIEEEITDTTLISQLNELEKAVSYDDTTNISQTNANLPFIINAEAFKKIS